MEYVWLHTSRTMCYIWNLSRKLLFHAAKYIVPNVMCNGIVNVQLLVTVWKAVLNISTGYKFVCWECAGSAGVHNIRVVRISTLVKVGHARLWRNLTKICCCVFSPFFILLAIVRPEQRSFLWTRWSGALGVRKEELAVKRSFGWVGKEGQGWKSISLAWLSLGLGMLVNFDQSFS